MNGVIEEVIVEDLGWVCFDVLWRMGKFYVVLGWEGYFWGVGVYDCGGWWWKFLDDVLGWVLKRLCGGKGVGKGF